MKAIFAALLLIAAVLYFSVQAAAEQTNPVPGMLTRLSVKEWPLPKQVSDLTYSNLYPGLYPVAVYRYREVEKGNPQINFACVGTVYQTGPNSLQILLPAHLFTKEKSCAESYAYGVRVLRPDEGRFKGFLDRIDYCSEGTTNARDILIAEIGCAPKWFASTSSIPESEGVAIFHSYTVTVAGKEVKTIRSLVNGNETHIIGYGVPISPEMRALVKEKEKSGKPLIISDLHPYIVVDANGEEGMSGTAFYDEYNRLYIMHGGPRFADTPDMVEAKEFYTLKYGHMPAGFSLLTGPIGMEEEK